MTEKFADKTVARAMQAAHWAAHGEAVSYQACLTICRTHWADRQPGETKEAFGARLAAAHLRPGGGSKKGGGT